LIYRRCQIRIGKMPCNPCYQSNFSSRLIRSIFQFDNAYCRANSGISPTPNPFLIVWLTLNLF
jgi:hypothetical protein